MTKKRSRLEIIRDILKEIKRENEIKPTRLLHKSNLSPQKFKEYLDELTQKDFIREKKQGKNKFFLIESKGEEYLDRYRNFSRFIENFGL